MFVENVAGIPRVLISWKHLRNETGVIYGKLKYRGKTVCSIETPERATISTGKAHVILPDNLCKNKGRKISLLNAMRRAGWSAETRKVVWDAYRNMRNGAW